VRPVLEIPTKQNNLDYFSEVLIESNLPFNVVPRPLTAAMIASEMPAAISPYSIAVAPDSSRKNFESRAFISFAFPLSLDRRVIPGSATGNLSPNILRLLKLARADLTDKLQEISPDF
jgi:hypothetical protein